MAFAETLRNTFFHQYKKILIIPYAIIAIALFIVIAHLISTGTILDRQVSLSGGSTATISDPNLPSLTTLEAQLKDKLPDISIHILTEFGSDKPIGAIIETSSEDPTSLKATLEEATGIRLTEDNFSLQVVGSSLGQTFYSQMIRSILFAFLFMAIVVFIMFRSPIPCITVVSCAFADMLVTIAFLNLFHIRVSTAGIAALLLLIGYSIDTDILLTNRALKRKEGTLEERTIAAMKTGITMTVTSFAASLIGFFLSTSPVLKEIFLIITVGLVADVLFTWLMNAPLIFWYITARKAHQ